MDFTDAKMVLGALVDDMFDRHFPDLKQNRRIRDAVLEVYLDFVADKTGHWTAVKASILITGQLNLREKKASPLHTARAILEWAIKTMEILSQEHEKDNRLFSLALPGPEIRRFFQKPPESSPGSAPSD
jgi:hypothetical protein